MAIVTARIDDKKKKQAMELADRFGVPLSTLINIRISDFLRTKRIDVGLDNEWFVDLEVNEPMQEVLNQMKKSSWKNG